MCSVYDVGKVEQSRSQEPGANDSSTAVVQQRRVRRILQTPIIIFPESEHSQTFTKCSFAVSFDKLIHSSM